MLVYQRSSPGCPLQPGAQPLPAGGGGRRAAARRSGAASRCSCALPRRDGRSRATVGDVLVRAGALCGLARCRCAERVGDRADRCRPTPCSPRSPPPSSCIGDAREAGALTCRCGIGFDIDGVLADFRTAFREAAVELPAPRGRRLTTTRLRSDRSPLSPSTCAGSGSTSRKTPNWWMEVPAYEPDQIARLYSLTRAAGWEVFFMTQAAAQRGRLGAVPDAVVDRAVRLLPAGGVDRAGLARGNRQRRCGSICSSTIR